MGLHLKHLKNYMDNMNKHYLYLGPKYTEAIHSFNIGINEVEGNAAYNVKIPCEQYTASKPEKDKKKKLSSKKNQEIISRKLLDNSNYIQKTQWWIGEFQSRCVRLAVQKEMASNPLNPTDPAYYVDYDRYNWPGIGNIYKLYQDQAINALLLDNPRLNRISFANSIAGHKRWMYYSLNRLIELRDSLYQYKRKLESNDKGIKPRVKFRRNDEGIPVFGEGTYVWGGLLWDTDKLYDYCKSNNFEYYWIDNAYIIPKMLNTTKVSGEEGKKNISRHKFGLVKIIKNGFHISELIDRPSDRLDSLEEQYGEVDWKSAVKKFKKRANKKYILVCPPSSDYERVFGYDNWLDKTVAEIKKHTNMEIKIREKKIRKTIPLTLDLKEAYCTVAPASAVSIESILAGVPTFCSDFSPAAPVGNLDLSKINKPYFPDEKLIKKWLNHLSYCQFSVEEIEDGTAWNILNNDI
tara:strand:+ start:3295 stop:4686 length:1392 start_codon:yes stop_codon:yes gene_type:complete